MRRRRPDAPSDDFVLPYGGPPVVTGATIAINVLVFLAMGISGVSWTEPGYQALVRSGANFGPLTLSGEWWRLLSSTFVHIGILRVALNMWCLWDLGSVLERLMGWKSFVITYIVTGIAGSELSLAWVFCCSTKAIRLPRFQCWRVPSSSTPIHCSSGTTSRSVFSELDIARTLPGKSIGL